MPHQNIYCILQEETYTKSLTKDIMILVAGVQIIYFF